MPRALVVASDATVASAVGLCLRTAGCTSMVAVTGMMAGKVPSASVDLAVLDLDVAGVEAAASQLRSSGVPVLVLTGRRASGAAAINDASAILAKPVRMSELLDHIRAAVLPDRVPDPCELVRGGVSMNTRTRRVTADGHPIDLSAREFALARELLEHAGTALPRTQLLKSVWGVEFDPRSNIVDVYVAYLRKKIGRRHIETVRGVGYRWR